MQPLTGEAIGKFIQDYGSFEVVKTDLAVLTPALEERGAENFLWLGFCWGGRVALSIAAEPNALGFAACGGIHAALKDDADLTAAPLAKALAEQIARGEPSKCIGVAFDGHPIMGPIGVFGGEVRLARPSFVGPLDVSKGDPVFVAGSGDLDACNGATGADGGPSEEPRRAAARLRAPGRPRRPAPRARRTPPRTSACRFLGGRRPMPPKNTASSGYPINM